MVTKRMLLAVWKIWRLQNKENILYPFELVQKPLSYTQVLYLLDTEAYEKLNKTCFAPAHWLRRMSKSTRKPLYSTTKNELVASR